MSVGHLARILEGRGIATVIIAIAAFAPTFARMNVPRALVTAHPMGRPMGPPHQEQTHRRVLRAALELLESAPDAGTIVHFESSYRP